MTDIKGYIEMRIKVYEHIVSRSSGTTRDVAQLALWDLQRILNAIIQEEKWGN